MRSDRLGDTLLPKRIALPVFASDALSSVAYATQEILLVLALAGTALLHLTWPAALGVVTVMATVVAAYRQNVHAYPSGGGDYEVANTNLGRPFGLVVAAALLVDYVLTVAVSTSAGVENLASTPLFSWMAGQRVATTLGVVVFIVLMNLRGIRESGTAFAIPTYAFMFSILGMIAVGLFRLGTGHDLQAATANYDIKPQLQNLGTAGIIFLGMRAFASGCTALTGVEAISNGVPAFRRPKSKNAATTLLLLGTIAITMLLSIIVLANRMGLKYVDNTDRLLGPDGQPMPPGFDQPTVMAQLSKAVFDNFTPGYYFVLAMTGIILVLAANTAFNGFPVLGSILARDGFMPRALGSRGDRLAYSNGIIVLAGFAIVLIVAFDAQTTRLIQLYIVGVFVSFNLSQLGMIRHWTRHLKTETDPAKRAHMMRSRVINTFGLGMTAVVFVIVLLTKFLAGAWIAILAMCIFFVLMKSIRRHYDNVTRELAADDEDRVLPTKVHAIVLVSKLHKPTLRALAYAKASRPNVLEAVYVGSDDKSTKALVHDWDERNLGVPLKVLYSPYREIVRPIIDYATQIRKANPRGVVAVYIPEYVVGRWWEQLLHNQTALRLKGRLLFTPGVMVTSVPYQLQSSQIARAREERELARVKAGDLRRGAIGRSPDDDRQVPR